MVEYSVSYDIKTKMCNLSELSNLIGINCDEEYSGDKDEKKSNGMTYWRVFSDSHETSTLAEHINSLLEIVSSSKVLLPEERGVKLPSDCEYYLSIGIFFNEESENDLAKIPIETLKEINKCGLWVEICLYPSNFEDDSE